MHALARDNPISPSWLIRRSGARRASRHRSLSEALSLVRGGRRGVPITAAASAIRAAPARPWRVPRSPTGRKCARPCPSRRRHEARSRARATSFLGAEVMLLIGASRGPRTPRRGNQGFPSPAWNATPMDHTTRPRKDRPIARRRATGGNRWSSPLQAGVAGPVQDGLASDTLQRSQARRGSSLFRGRAGGFSTLERDDHMHAVMVLRGADVLVGREVRNIDLHDLIAVRPEPGTSFAPP